MPSAIVFDLDDTLYAEEQFILSGFHAVAQYLDLKGLASDLFTQLEKLYKQGVRGHIFDEALLHIGLEPTHELVSEMLNVYRTHTPIIDLYPDAVHVLETLYGTHQLGLLSDGYLEVQKKKIAALNIDRYFQAIVLTDEFGRENWKPSPVPYTAILEKMKVSPSDAVYVADNPAKDFVTARKIGWRTVQVQRPFGQYRDLIPAPGYAAHYQITDLTELLSLPLDN